MFELTPQNAVEYLAGRPDAPPGPWRVSVLGGGVSNTVLLAECDSCRFVMKQSLGKLRVQEDWFADRRRIHRECAGMRALAPHLPPGSVPAILFEDRENCTYAMAAAPAEYLDWKRRLLQGEFDAAVARRVGQILAAQIRVSWRSEELEAAFGDQTHFDQLRLDPYYRFTAGRYPGLAGPFQERIEDCRRRRRALVHGDFSPKNFLVGQDRVVLIDWEVVHYGDPSFDAAFLLNHLLLKAVHMPRHAGELANLAGCFWRELHPALPPEADWFEAGTIAHLGCLHMARVDGKSPAEYLTAHGKQRARDIARGLIENPPPTVAAVFDRLHS